MGDFAMFDPIWNFSHFAIFCWTGLGDSAIFYPILNFANLAIFPLYQYGGFALFHPIWTFALCHFFHTCMTSMDDFAIFTQSQILLV